MRLSFEVHPSLILDDIFLELQQQRSNSVEASDSSSADADLL
jgi:hypothetical protein